MDVKDEEMDKETVPDIGIPKESNCSNTTDPIPIQQSSEHRLLKAQKHARDSLAKCISAVFTIDDVTVCEVSLGAKHLYNLIVSSTQSSDGSDLPSFPLLQKAGVTEYRKKMRMQDKARRTVMKYKKRKQESQTSSKPKGYCLCDEPLSQCLKNTVVRPKKKIIGVPLSEETRAAKLESKNSVKVCKINTSIDIITLKPGLLNYCVQDNDDTLERKLNVSKHFRNLGMLQTP